MQGVGSKIPNSAASSLLFARKLGAINGVVINSDI
jgi:hypothetical protein